jgi:hypothetical protein
MTASSLSLLILLVLLIYESADFEQFSLRSRVKGGLFLPRNPFIFYAEAAFSAAIGLPNSEM